MVNWQYYGLKWRMVKLRTSLDFQIVLADDKSKGIEQAPFF
jgi:hypothetical protein